MAARTVSILAALVCAIVLCAPISAQAQNVQCLQTPAVGTSNTTCANTAFVTNSIAAGAPAPNVQTGNYTIASTDCNVTVVETGAFKTITLPSAAGFPSNCGAIHIVNGSATRGQKLSGFPVLPSPLLWPSQSLDVVIVAGSWIVTRAPGEWFTAPPTFYFNATSGSDSNDCLATGVGACATAQQAINLCLFNVHAINGGQAGCTIQADCESNYNQRLHVFTQVPGAHAITVLGNPASPASCQIVPSDAGGSVVDVEDTGGLILNGFEIGDSSGATLINFRQLAIGDIGNIIFGSNPGGVDILITNFASLNLDTNLTMSGNASAFILLSNYGYISWNGNTINATTVISVNFILDVIGSTFDAGPIVFTGSRWAGTTYSCGNNAVLTLNSTTFPVGMTAGSASTGCVVHP